MSLLRRPATASVAALAAAAVVAGPVAVVTAGAASAAEREGRCDRATFQLEVEREDGGFEVSADIDDAAPGSRWKVVLEQDGRTYVSTTRRADGDGEVSLDRDRANTRGADVFTLRVNKVGTGGGCTHTIRFAR